jgi:hypothetical protein
VKLIPWNTKNRRIGCWIGWLLPKPLCLFFLLLQTKASKRNPTSNNTRCEDHLSNKKSTKGLLYRKRKASWVHMLYGKLQSVYISSQKANLVRDLTMTNWGACDLHKCCNIQDILDFYSISLPNNDTTNVIPNVKIPWIM